MIELVGQFGEIGMTIQIKRAATGETETVNLVGKVMSVEEGESDEAEE